MSGTDPQRDGCPTASGANVHASLVTIQHEGRRHGILIEGKPGSGKSSLAMGLIETFRRAGSKAYLVSDDQVLIEASTGVVTGHAPASIAGKVEIRGHGIAETGFRESSPVTLVVRLVPDGEIERMPDEQTTVIAGIAFPLVLVPERHEAQAVRIVVAALTGRHF